jgi:hypothetical protein
MAARTCGEARGEAGGGELDLDLAVAGVLREVLGRAVGEGDDDRHGEGVEVGGGPGLAEHLLDREVAEGADAGRAELGLAALAGLRGAEVDQHRRAGGGDDDVGGLDVAVNDGRM